MKQTYYAHITGSANITTEFIPANVYTANGNYIKFVYNGDILDHSNDSGKTIFQSFTSSLLANYVKGFWFREGNSTDKQYVAYATVIHGTFPVGKGYYWDTDGFKNTCTYEAIKTDDSSTGITETLTLGEQAVTVYGHGRGAFSAVTGAVVFFPTSMGNFSDTADNLNMNFYRLKVYGQNDTLLYDFFPAKHSSQGAGLWDDVNAKFFPASDQTKIELLKVPSFSTDITAITADYSGVSTSITLTTEEGVSWSATCPEWVSLSQMEGTDTTTLTATISKNNSYNPRTGSIIFTSENQDTAEVLVSQAKHPLLVPVGKIYKGENILD